MAFTVFRKFFGGAVNTASGYAIGGAMQPALDPLTQELANKTWALHPDRPIDPYVLAEGVAEGKIGHDAAQTMASHSGISGDNFDSLVTIATEALAVSEAYRLWRRSIITEGEFRTIVKRLGVGDEWADALVKAKEELLDPAQLAAAIHRGLVPDPGLLKGEQPTGPFTVEAYPVYPIDAVDEAAGSGYDKDRLGVLVGLQGLPMGTHEAAQAYFRGIITKGDYIRAFNESNSRNEWAEAVLGYARQIPTARDYIENALRGYRTLEEAQAGAARHGMSPEDARLIFQNAGRPLNLHQITQALAWGAKYNPLPGDDPDPYMNSVLIGSVTPAYYEMQDALKYTLPGYFVVKAMLANNTLTTEEAATIFKRQAWPPDLAEKAATALGSGADGAKTNPWVLKAETQLWTSLHKDYVKTGLSRAEVEPALTKLIDQASVRDDVFALWETERKTAAESPPTT